MANFETMAGNINKAILDAKRQFAQMTDQLWLCDYPVENFMQAIVAQALSRDLTTSKSNKRKFVYPEACIVDMREATKSAGGLSR